MCPCSVHILCIWPFLPALSLTLLKTLPTAVPYYIVGKTKNTRFQLPHGHKTETTVCASILEAVG